MATPRRIFKDRFFSEMSAPMTPTFSLTAVFRSHKSNCCATSFHHRRYVLPLRTSSSAQKPAALFADFVEHASVCAVCHSLSVKRREVFVSHAPVGRGGELTQVLLALTPLTFANASLSRRSAVPTPKRRHLQHPGAQHVCFFQTQSVCMTRRGVISWLKCFWLRIARLNN